MVTLPPEFEDVIKQQTEQFGAALAEASNGRLGSGFNVQETIRLFVAAIMGAADVLLALRTTEGDDYISRASLVAWLRERGAILDAGHDPAAAEVFRLAARLEQRLPLDADLSVVDLSVVDLSVVDPSVVEPPAERCS